MELWTGRADAVDIKVNGRSIGPIGSGTVKNIRILRQGVKAGDKWLIRGKE